MGGGESIELYVESLCHKAKKERNNCQLPEKSEIIERRKTSEKKLRRKILKKDIQWAIQQYQNYSHLVSRSGYATQHFGLSSFYLLHINYSHGFCKNQPTWKVVSNRMHSKPNQLH